MNKINGFLYSRTLLFFVIAVLALTAQLFLLNKFIVVSFNYQYNSLAFKLYSAAIALADALVLLAVYWLLPQRRKGWTWLVFALMTIYSIVQVLYYPTYHDIMPWSSFTYVQNVGTILIRSALGEVRASHALLLVPVAVLVVLYVKWRGSIAAEVTGGAKRVWMTVGCVLAYVLIHSALLACSFNALVQQEGTIGQRVKGYTQLVASHTRYYLKYGFVAYGARAAIHTVMENRSLDEVERCRVKDFLAAQPQYTDNVYGQAGKNLILIIVESLNAWVIDLKLDGREVTPVLNKLCADSTALVALHMKTQVKTGHSSDGHFMYNTGLLPLTTESVAMNYGNRDYPALAKALKNYDSFVAICDAAHVWNQGETTFSYGFNRLYDFEELRPTLEQCDWVMDRALLRRAPELLAQARQPFFAQIVTVNMHSPYDELRDVPAGWVSKTKAYTRSVRNYLEATALFDQELGLFLDKIKNMGLYDNSVIVIASDHTERVDDAPKGRASLSREGDDCVLIALNTGHGARIDAIIGQVDVYPTILDVMGANQYAWKGLGHSVLRGPSGAAAIAPDQVKGNVPAVVEKRLKEAWTIADLMITRQYFKNR